MYESEKECQQAIDGLNKAGLQASFARVGQVTYMQWDESRVYTCITHITCVGIL